jgi:hypothetical protein
MSEFMANYGRYGQGQEAEAYAEKSGRATREQVKAWRAENAHFDMRCEKLKTHAPLTETKDEFLALLREHRCRVTAAKAVGEKWKTVRYWLKSDSKFRKKYDEVEQEWVAIIEDARMRAAMDGHNAAITAFLSRRETALPTSRGVSAEALAAANASFDAREEVSN